MSVQNSLLGIGQDQKLVEACCNVVPVPLEE